MKKLFVILSSVLALGFSAKAQDTFYPGWNYGIQAGATYTAGMGKFGDLVSVPTIALNAGYEFNPWFGLRADLSGWQGKGVVIGQYYDDYNSPFFDSGQKFGFNYVQLGVDAMFDICNIFNYKADRFCSPYLFLGVDANLRFNNGALDHKVDVNYTTPNQQANNLTGVPADYAWLWENPVLAIGGRLGLGANFRVNDAVKISFELVDNLLPNAFNSMCDNGFTQGFLSTTFNHPFTFHIDHNISALLGVKLTFGQASQKAAAEAAAAAAAAAAAKAAADAAAAKAAAAKAAAEKAAAEKAAAEKAAAEKAAADAAAAAAKAAQDAKDAVAAALENSVANPLFVIGKYNLTKEAKEKVEAAAEILKVNPSVNVTLTGYADKETGTSKGNMDLSQKRAEAVADALVAAGVSASQLSTKWVGDTQVPFEGAKPAEKRTVTFNVD